MKPTALSLSTSLAAFAVATTLTFSARAQEAPPPAVAPVAPAATAPMTTDVTTTTAADSASSTDTIGGSSAAQPETRDTVTVTRSIRPNRPWLFTGSAILIGTYVTTAVIQTTQGRAVEDRSLLIPVAGPWINLANRNCDGCTNETTNIALVIGSGVLQGVGAAMALASLFIPEHIEAATIQAGPAKMLITPTSVGQSSVGVGTVGVF